MDIDIYLEVIFENLITGEKKGTFSFTRTIKKDSLPKAGESISLNVGDGAVFCGKNIYSFTIEESGMDAEAGFINLMPEVFPSSFKKEFSKQWGKVAAPMKQGSIA